MSQQPNVNLCIFTGRVGRDAVIRYTTSGIPMAMFSLAVDTQSFNKEIRTVWLECVAWNHVSEIAEKIVRKGSSIYIEAGYQEYQWEDQAGKSRTKIQMNVRNILLLEAKRQVPEQQEMFGQDVPDGYFQDDLQNDDDDVEGLSCNGRD